MTKLLYKFFIAALFLFGTGKLAAQNVRVNAVLDSSKIRIGEQVKLDIYVNIDAGQNNSITWPKIGDTLTEKIEVVSVTPIDTTFPDKGRPSNMLQHQQITVSAYDSGYFAIPGFKFVVNNDTANALFTQPLFLEVHTVPTDTSATKIKDIKAPFDEPFNWKWYMDYIIWGGIGLLLIGIAIIVYYYYNKNRKQAVVEPEKPKVPAHITALATLERIKDTQEWKEGRVKEYYSSISDAVRLYIEQRFVVNALESTTDEIMTAFRSQVVDKDSKDKLQQLLTLSDLVKFAKQAPIEMEHAITLQNAFDFVNGTRREDEMQIAPDGTTVQPQATPAAPTYSPPVQQPVSQSSYAPPGQQSANTYTAPVKTTDAGVEAPSKKRRPFKDWTWKQWVVFVVIFILAYLIGHFAFKGAQVLFSQSHNKEAMQTISAQLNKGCPMKVDFETQLDSTSVIDDKTFQYNYSLYHRAAEELNLDEIQSKLQPALINNVSTNPLMVKLREKDVIFQYAYWDMNGKFLFMIKVGPEEYKQ